MGDTCQEFCRKYCECNLFTNIFVFKEIDVNIAKFSFKWLQSIFMKSKWTLFGKIWEFWIL